MASKRKTILDILLQENNTNTKTDNGESEITQQQLNLMVQKTAEAMISAQKVIARAVRKRSWRLIKFRKNQDFYSDYWNFDCLDIGRQKFIADIYYEADYDIAETVYLVGEFTSPAWETVIPMKYSFFYRSFMAKIKISEGDQFKFIINGTFVWCNRYPLIYTKEKFSNNWFTLRRNLSKNFHLKLINPSKSFGEFGNSNTTLNRSKELYLRKRNSKILGHFNNNILKHPKLLSGSSVLKFEGFSPDITLRKRSILSKTIQPSSIMSADKQEMYTAIARLGTLDPYTSSLDRYNTDYRTIEGGLHSNVSKKAISDKKIKNIIIEHTKTPLQIINNPITAHSFGDDNHSLRDDFSDFSDDDLYFIDEFLINTPFEVNNNEQNLRINDDIESRKNTKSSQADLRTQMSDKVYEFVGNSVKTSKNSSKPCGDSWFVSKLGMGIADGVGGWSSYGIDSSKFSTSLMENCKAIVDSKSMKLINWLVKELENFDHFTKISEKKHKQTKPKYYNLRSNELSNSLQSESHTCSSNDHIEITEIAKAFGTPSKKKKGLKRVRSSFYLDKKNLNSKSRKDISPNSDSTCKDKMIKASDLKIDPKKIMKDAYKQVTNYGSSTALIWTLHNKTMKISNLGDSTCMLVRYIPGDKSHVILKTEEQQHSFNAPYQLAKLPKKFSSIQNVSMTL